MLSKKKLELTIMVSFERHSEGDRPPSPTKHTTLYWNLYEIDYRRMFSLFPENRMQGIFEAERQFKIFRLLFPYFIDRFSPLESETSN
jgi:hypothetical protein